MVKGTIIEEKTVFRMIQPEDLCRQFNKRVFIKNSRFISSLFTFSPETPLFIGFSGGEEFSLSLHPLFTPLHPYWICNTLYTIWEEKALGAIRIGGFPYLSLGIVSTESAVSGLPSNQLFPGLSPHPYLLPAYS